MKGDFSRQTFAARKHYSGVLMQQGRVQLDADWNEQGSIDRYRAETEAVDVIGGCGAPLHAAGFEITTDGKTLLIGGGRYYVDGLLAENDAGKIAFEDQDKLDLPGANMDAVLTELKEKGLSAALVYLDVWQRHMTALDDKLLREVALGGPDTATRLKTVWQVKTLPLAGGNSVELAELLAKQKQLADELTQLKEIDDKIGTEAAVIKQKLDQAAPTSPEFKKLQVLLQKATAKLAEVQAETEKRKAQLAELAKKIGELGGGNAAPACDAQVPGWDALFAPSGLLNARAQPPDPTQDPCLTPPGAGYRRLENQLYRVEIHQGGPRGQATFKWSRDNGSVVTTIESIKGSVITVHDVGPDDALGFAHGQWVEITDDVLELNGQFGQLAQIDKVNTATREITLLNVAPQPLAATPTGVNAARHPKLRRWDQADQAARAGLRQRHQDRGRLAAAGRWRQRPVLAVGPVSHRRLLADPRPHGHGRTRMAAVRSAESQPAAAASAGDRASLLPAGADPGAGWGHRQECHGLSQYLPAPHGIDCDGRQTGAARDQDQLGQRRSHPGRFAHARRP